MIAVLRMESFWKFLYRLLRALYPALKLLRLADMAGPCMDKLYFFTCKCDTALLDELHLLNDWSTSFDFLNDCMQKNFGERTVPDDGNKDGDDCSTFSDTIEEEDSDTEFDGDNDGDSVASDPDNGSKHDFGNQVLRCWERRKPKLLHDLSKAAAVLSPDPSVMMHCDEHLDLDLKEATERMLVKLFLPTHLTATEVDEWKAENINIFWDEYEEFSTKTGPVFGPSRKWIWASKDIANNKSHLWHKKHSLPNTKWLGKLGCRVTSKINGMGNAERCWGAVKHLKDNKRSHLSAKSVTMQATVYGAASAKRVALERRFKETEEVVSWEDEDLKCIGLDRFGINTEALVGLPNAPVRLHPCWTEDWEEEAIHSNDLEMVAMPQRKHAGMSFTESTDVFTLHPKRLHWRKQRGNSQWEVIACTAD